MQFNKDKSEKREKYDQNMIKNSLSSKLSIVEQYLDRIRHIYIYELDRR